MVFFHLLGKVRLVLRQDLPWLRAKVDRTLMARTSKKSDLLSENLSLRLVDEVDMLDFCFNPEFQVSYLI